MNLTPLQWYVVIINLCAFVIYTIDFQIYMHGGDGIRPAVLCNLATICGGAIGTLAAEILWDRRINKRNAQSRIYTLVWLILQLALFWAMWGPNRAAARDDALRPSYLARVRNRRHNLTFEAPGLWGDRAHSTGRSAGMPPGEGRARMKAK